ncbi:hypothetical protein ACWV26_12965 [Rummeliibacillus sp. JY-2-4R]
MIKSTLRSFGCGIFLAGSLMSLSTHFNSNDSNIPSKASLVNSKDTVVIKKSELNALKEETTNVKAQLAKIQTNYNNLKADQTTKKNSVKSYTLVIKKGMGTSEVSKALKNGGIIKDDAEFERYIINRDQAKFIQIGDYKISSDMTNEEILTIITKPK